MPQTREQKQATYALRILKGQCIKCWRPALLCRVVCEVCREKRAAYDQATRHPITKEPR